MNVGIRLCHECYTSLCHNVTQVCNVTNYQLWENPLPCARRSIDLFVKKFHFLLYRYRLFVFQRKPNGRAMKKMKKIKSHGQETQQMLRERFLALLLIELVSYPFFPEGSSIVGHKTTMSDKIS